jgi:hypothetical protein
MRTSAIIITSLLALCSPAAVNYAAADDCSDRYYACKTNCPPASSVWECRRAAEELKREAADKERQRQSLDRERSLSWGRSSGSSGSSGSSMRPFNDPREDWLRQVPGSYPGDYLNRR